MKFKKVIMSILISLIFLLPIGLLGILINKSNKEKTNSTVVNSTEQSVNVDEKVNIALFGLDRRSENEKARSDSIMLASIDMKKRKIEIISLLRDTLVEIEGHGKDKLNHAYSYGGPSLALDTINKNFDLDIDKYVAVDFFSLAKIIDIIGGVDIELRDSEANEINKNLVEINNIENLPKGTDYLEGGGLKKLNGRQAVAYSRIRNEGNGDYERTQRQRKVLKAIAKEYLNMNSDKKFEASMEIIGQVSTNIPINYIKDLANKITSTGSFTINQHIIPYENSFETNIVNKMWVIEADMSTNIKELHKYLK